MEIPLRSLLRSLLRPPRATSVLKTCSGGKPFRGRVQLLHAERPGRLVATDLLVIGTWVEGLVLAAVGPAKAAMAAIERLPRLAEMPVGIFCTNFNPGGTLKTLQSA